MQRNVAAHDDLVRTGDGAHAGIVIKPGDPGTAEPYSNRNASSRGHGRHGPDLPSTIQAARSIRWALGHEVDHQQTTPSGGVDLGFQDLSNARLDSVRVTQVAARSAPIFHRPFWEYQAMPRSTGQSRSAASKASRWSRHG